MPTLRLHSWSSVSHTVRGPQALAILLPHASPSGRGVHRLAQRWLAWAMPTPFGRAAVARSQPKQKTSGGFSSRALAVNLRDSPSRRIALSHVVVPEAHLRESAALRLNLKSCMWIPAHLYPRHTGQLPKAMPSSPFSLLESEPSAPPAPSAMSAGGTLSSGGVFACLCKAWFPTGRGGPNGGEGWQSLPILGAALYCTFDVPTLDGGVLFRVRCA